MPKDGIQKQPTVAHYGREIRAKTAWCRNYATGTQKRERGANTEPTKSIFFCLLNSQT